MTGTEMINVLIVIHVIVVFWTGLAGMFYFLTRK